jgi:hypothetical protein
MKEEQKRGSRLSKARASKRPRRLVADRRQRRSNTDLTVGHLQGSTQSARPKREGRASAYRSQVAAKSLRKAGHTSPRQ